VKSSAPHTVSSRKPRKAGAYSTTGPLPPIDREVIAHAMREDAGGYTLLAPEGQDPDFDRLNEAAARRAYRLTRVGVCSGMLRPWGGK
jgi:hypothetical protein